MKHALRTTQPRLPVQGASSAATPVFACLLPLLMAGCGDAGEQASAVPVEQAGEPARADPAREAERPRRGDRPRKRERAAGAELLLADPADELEPGWLPEVSADWGIGFHHHSGAKGELHLPEIMGGGAAALDYDQDGRLDLYFVDGGDPADPTARGPARNRLLRNVAGESGPAFVDTKDALGAVGGAYGMGVVVGDFDGDGFPDLHVTNLGPDDLYRNEGGQHFVAPEDRGDRPTGWACSGATLDLDRDGDLDLFLTRYVEYLSHKRCFDQADRKDYCGPTSFQPVSDLLLRNEGGMRFKDVSHPAGIAVEKAAGLGVVCEDFDADGWVDVYVANDTYANHLWINRTDGSFVDDAVLLGVAFDMNGNHEAGMGVIAEDFDGDLLTDLFVTHLKHETNTLYRNLGPEQGFADTTGRWGLAASSRALTGFGTLPLDLDTDGDLDLLVVNGMVGRGEPAATAHVPAPWNLYAEPNLLYLNHGAGRFEASDVAPLFAGRREVSRGLVAADLDGDGDADLVVTQIEGPAHAYRNDAPRSGHWILVDAREHGRPAIGAGLVLELDGEPRVRRSIRRSGGYLTSSDPRTRLSWSGAAQDVAIEVRWTDGTYETFALEGVDRVWTLVRGAGKGGG